MAVMQQNKAKVDPLIDYQELNYHVDSQCRCLYNQAAQMMAKMLKCIHTEPQENIPPNTRPQDAVAIPDCENWQEKVLPDMFGVWPNSAGIDCLGGEHGGLWWECEHLSEWKKRQFRQKEWGWKGKKTISSSLGWLRFWMQWSRMIQPVRICVWTIRGWICGSMLVA